MNELSDSWDGELWNGDREGDSTNVYQCSGCTRFRPWCDGAADDLPELCDSCWALAHESWWMKIVRFVLPLIPKGKHGCDACRVPRHRLKEA